jgi:antitoxin (DNA-binding transcriptional repressor) of toxin-antitoxin stability system
MKIASVRDVRNRFSELEAWVEEGQKVEIRKRGKAIAWLVPIPRDHKKKFVMPDFAARRKAIWGSRVFTASEVKAMREAELEGEEG